MSETTRHTRHGLHDSGVIDEMKKVCLQWTTDKRGKPILAGSIYNRFLLRQISIYVTWLFVRLGISAHMATLLMTIAGLSGIVLCLPRSIHLTIMGAICFFLFDLLDAVDGEVARWTGTSTTRGLYLDQISHVFVDYPSRAVAALHLYMWTSNELYMILAIIAVASPTIGRAVREICLRINAEAQAATEQTQNPKVPTSLKADAPIMVLSKHLKTIMLATFPLVKARVVHIATIIGILLSYRQLDGFLSFLCWFFAIYSAAWLVLEVPYYFFVRVANVSHAKRVEEYKWPI